MDEEGSRIVWVVLISVLVALGLISAVRKSISSIVNSGLRAAEQGSVAWKLTDAYTKFPESPVVISGFRLFLLMLISILMSLWVSVIGSKLPMAMLLSILLIITSVAAADFVGSLLGRKWPEFFCLLGLKATMPIVKLCSPLLRLLPVHPWQASPLVFLQQPTWDSITIQQRNGVGGPENKDAQMVESVLELKQTQVKELLVPRVDIIASDVNASPDEVIHLALSYGFSRIPVFDETIDKIVGIVYTRDLLRFLQEGSGGGISLQHLARTPMFVPETKSVYDLLQDFQDRHIHIAVVVDEYGGTAGLVTIEDLLEEIVGEIEDEFDLGEPKFQQVAENEIIVDAKLGLDDLNDLIGVHVEGQGFDTLGGLIYNRLGKVPAPGDTIVENDLNIEVLSTASKRIRRVKITVLAESDVQH